MAVRADRDRERANDGVLSRGSGRGYSLDSFLALIAGRDGFMRCRWRQTEAEKNRRSSDRAADPPSCPQAGCRRGGIGGALIAFVSLSLMLSGLRPAFGQQNQPAGRPGSRISPIPLNVVDHRWEIPAGQPADRENTQRFQRALETLRTTAPDDIQWLDLLASLQIILDSPQDSLLAMIPEPAAAPAPDAPVQPDAEPLRENSPPLIRASAAPRFSLSAVTERLIGNLPAAGRQAYLQLYGAVAQSELEAALKADQEPALAEVSRRFLHTPAGYEATERLASRALDQQQPLAALRELGRLHAVPEIRLQREPFLSLKIAAAWLTSGRQDRAAETLRELDQWLKQHPPRDGTRPEGGPEQMQAWLEQTVVPLRPSNRVVEQWTHFGGSPDRVAGASPFSPIGPPAWSRTTSGSTVQPTEDERRPFLNRAWIEADEDPIARTPGQMTALLDAGYEYLLEQDIDRGLPLLPAMHPLIVNGTAIFRTLRQVQAVELSTGRLLWSSIRRDPAFEEQFDPQSSRIAERLPRESVLSPLHHMQEAVIRTRTRHDRAMGTLSSNGRLVFALEHCGIPSRRMGAPSFATQRSVPREWNRLTAIELQTGILKWEVGGPRGQRSLPAAGTMFLGPPATDGEKLFVLGEAENSVLLFCLNAADGAVLWSQPLLNPHASARFEALRRSTGDSPVPADGLLICPISSGSIIGFDPALRRIVWIANYRSQTWGINAEAAALNRLPAHMIMSDSSLLSTQRWQEGILMVTGGKVLAAPADSSELLCLDAANGERLWSQPRGNGLYLAAVLEDRALIVEQEGLRAVRLSDGQTLWHRGMRGTFPTGRGVRTGSIYHLPTGTPRVQRLANDQTRTSLTGEILSISMETGRTLSSSPTADGLPLGNLAVSGQRLISQRLDALVALDVLPSVVNRLNRTLAAQPQNREALADRARLALHQGRTADGLRDLKAAAGDQPDAALQTLLVDQVLEQLRSGELAAEDIDGVLGTMQLSADNRFRLNRNQVEALQSTGQHEEAFRVLMTLARQRDLLTNALTVPGQRENVVLNATAWASSELKSSYILTTANQKPSAVMAMDQQIAAEWNESDVDRQRFWLERFGWHATANERRLQLAGRLDPDRDFLEIEQLLSTVAAAVASEPGLAFQGETALMRHWLETGHRRTVAAQLNSFRDRWKDQPQASGTISNGKTLEALLDEWRSRLAAEPAEFQWSLAGPGVLTRAVPPVNDLWSRTRLLWRQSPVLAGMTLQLTPSGWLTRNGLNQPRMLLPVSVLESSAVPGGVHPDVTSAVSHGHVLALCTGAGLLVLDLSGTEPRILWTRQLAEHDGRLFKVPSYRNLGGQFIRASDRQPIGTMDFMTSRFLVFREGRSLVVADLRTGRTVWQLFEDLSECVVFGDEQHVTTVSDENGTRVLEIETGRQVARHGWNSRDLLGTAGSDPVLLLRDQATQHLTRINALTGQSVWSESLSREVILQFVNSRWMALMDPDGRLKILDVDSGRAIVDAAIEKEPSLIRMHIHETADSFVVLSGTALQDQSTILRPVRNYARNVAQHPIDSWAYGFSRQSGERLWARKLPRQYVSESQARDLPVVVLACERFTNGGAVSPTRQEDSQLIVLDTRTGQTVFETAIATPGFTWRIEGDPASREIRLDYGNQSTTLIWPPQSR